MSPISKITLLSLASSALAAPFRGHGHGHHTHSRHGHHGVHHPGHHTAHPADSYEKDIIIHQTKTKTVVVTAYPDAGATFKPVGKAEVVQTIQAYCTKKKTLTRTNYVTVTLDPTAAYVPEVPSTTSTPCTTSTSTEDAVQTDAYTQGFVYYSSEEPTSSTEEPVAPSYAPVVPSYAPVSTVDAVETSSSSSSAPHYEPTPVKQVAPVEPKPKPAPAPVTPAPAPYVPGNGKRGLAYNDASLTECFVGKSKVTWGYNWGQTRDGLPSNFEYVPLLWSTRPDFTKNWFSNAKKAIDSGSKHLLCFNEPDYSGQANMSPDAAAAGFLTYMQPFKTSHPSVRLGGPAVTNGGNGMGLDWLSKFAKKCSSCAIDFYPIHWYDSATNIEYFKNHVKEAHEKTGKPIWVTEFGATGSDAQISHFLQEVMAWMDSQPYVERYSYFMVSNGKLVNGKSLSNYGNTYANA